jgi:hypothetical protein
MIVGRNRTFPGQHDAGRRIAADNFEPSIAHEVYRFPPTVSQ